MTYQEYYQREHLSKHFDYANIPTYQLEILKTGNTSMKSLVIAMLFQQEHGIQLYVQKALSDEMMNVDAHEITFDEIIWPHESIEVYFEDPYLPTILFQKYGRENNIYFPQYKFNYHTSKYAVKLSFPVQVTDSEGNYFSGGSSYNIHDCDILSGLNMKQFVKTEIKETFDKDHLKTDVGNYAKFMDCDKEITNFYFNLICKIFLYISIPRYKAIEIHKNDLPKNSCKPGVKGRPKTKILKAIYVPEIHYIGQHSENDKLHGISKKPHMRRGHFRVLHSDKFVNKQHEIVYVKPCFIHGGSTENKLYIARKVNT